VKKTVHDIVTRPERVGLKVDYIWGFPNNWCASLGGFAKKYL
jgi:hypothetical protein